MPSDGKLSNTIGFHCGKLSNTTEFPSGDQSAQNSLPSSERTWRGVPPWAETIYIFHTPPDLDAVNRMRFASGDQRGLLIRIGGNVSCSFWVPSILLRHRDPS